MKKNIFDQHSDQQKEVFRLQHEEKRAKEATTAALQAAVGSLAAVGTKAQEWSGHYDQMLKAFPGADVRLIGEGFVKNAGGVVQNEIQRLPNAINAYTKAAATHTAIEKCLNKAKERLGVLTAQRDAVQKARNADRLRNQLKDAEKPTIKKPASEQKNNEASLILIFLCVL